MGGGKAPCQFKAILPASRFYLDIVSRETTFLPRSPLFRYSPPFFQSVVSIFIVNRSAPVSSPFLCVSMYRWINKTSESVEIDICVCVCVYNDTRWRGSTRCKSAEQFASSRPPPLRSDTCRDNILFNQPIVPVSSSLDVFASMFDHDVACSIKREEGKRNERNERVAIISEAASRVVISRIEGMEKRRRRRQSFTIVAFQVLLASKVDRSPSRSRTDISSQEKSLTVSRFGRKICINLFPKPRHLFLFTCSLSLSLFANSTRRKEAWRRRVKYFQPICRHPTLDSLLCLCHSTLRVIPPNYGERGPPLLPILQTFPLT